MKATSSLSILSVSSVLLAGLILLSLSTAMELYHLEEHKVLICICSQCGGTSLLQWMSLLTTQHPLSYRGDPWRNRFDHTEVKKVPDNQATQLLADTSIKSFVFVRDPVERAVSFWKSKISCDVEKYATNVHEQYDILENMLRHANVKLPDRTQFVTFSNDGLSMCANMDQFIQLLQAASSEPEKFPKYIRPQANGCFAGGRDPSNWDEVLDIGAKDPAARLIQHIGNAPSFPHLHGAPSDAAEGASFILTAAQLSALEDITKSDRNILAPYLQA